MKTSDAVPLGAILITGCSTGIGRACALRMHEMGFAVIASARTLEQVDELRRLGLTAVRLDVADQESITYGVQEALRLAGNQGIRGIFANAGYGQAGALEDIGADALRAQLETNVIGMHEVNRLLIPHMRAMGGGRIVLNSSVLGLVAMRWKGAYVISKWGIEAYGDVLRLELQPFGFQVSIIEPGPVLTRFRANSLKALNTYVKTSGSVHESTYVKLREKLSKEGPAVPFTVSAEHCVRHVAHAFSAKRPRIRYRITLQTHVFGTLKRLLPTRIMDVIASRG